MTKQTSMQLDKETRCQIDYLSQRWGLAGRSITTVIRRCVDRISQQEGYRQETIDLKGINLDNLPVLSTNAICPKCRCGGVTENMGVIQTKYETHEGIGVMKRTCPNCGYHWYEKPKDRTRKDELIIR